MMEDKRSVYVAIDDIITSLGMKGKSGVYINMHGIDVFDYAENYRFSVSLSDGILTIDVLEV